MKLSGPNEIVPLFHPHALLIRELKRSDPRKRQVFFAENSEISLVCQRTYGQTFAPNIMLVNDGQCPKPGIEITGHDDLGLKCRLTRVRYHPSHIELVFTPQLAYGLDLTPEGMKLPQVKMVIVDTMFGRLTVTNPDFRDNARPLRSAIPSLG